MKISQLKKLNSRPTPWHLTKACQAFVDQYVEAHKEQTLYEASVDAYLRYFDEVYSKQSVFKQGY